MKLLALETSSDLCSVALLSRGQVMRRHGQLPKQHASVILNWIGELLSQAETKLEDLDAVAYSCGPGSFTGIRISAAVGQGLCLAHAIPLIPVPSMQAIAQGVHRAKGYEQVKIILDARMEQVYYGHYVLGSDGLMEYYQEDALQPRKNVNLARIKAEKSFIVTDLPELKQLFPENIVSYCPDAYNVLEIAQTVFLHKKIKPLEHALPVYLRSEKYWQKII